MEYKTICYEVKTHYAILTINRPDEMNALNHLMLHEIEGVLTQVQQNSDVWGLIITGKGKAFIAGADIKEIPVGNPEAERKGVIEAQNIINKIAGLEIPTIAAVNGYALGGGNELAMACDLCIASSKAIFGQPEVSLGVNICYGGSQRLTRLVGPRIAKELLFTGRHIGAEEAKEIGLVNQIVKPEDLMTTAEELMQKICRMAPISVRYSKLLVDYSLETNAVEMHEMERNMASVCIVTEDLKEGVEAFIRKRNAVFYNK